MTKPAKTESILPVPEEAALEQSAKLVERIKEGLDKAGGEIGFDQYMNMALYEPGLGYYSAGSRKFGEAGDFVTAPEISPLFAQCLANQCGQILSELDSGVILELGAGTGVMARDLLLALEKQQALPETYFILEVSADLKQRQQTLFNETAPHLVERVVWLDALPEEGITGIILGNEVLDALPVKRFKKTASGFSEQKVVYADDQFEWQDAEADEGLLQTLTELEAQLPESLSEGLVSEINTGLEHWLTALEVVLKQGVMLFIDYGYTAAEYYHPQRTDGSLLCHYRHHVHADPFYYPGLQDITSSVDFTAVAERADSLGMHVSGYTSQAYFLFACGLESMVAGMEQLETGARLKIAQQVRMLTMPEEMGERFKVIALTKQFDQTLIGFSVMDQRVRL